MVAECTWRISISLTSRTSDRMTAENPIQQRAWLRVARTSVMFRLNTGKGWVSGKGQKGVHRMKNGSVELEAPRPIALGFSLVNREPVVGAHDLIGRTTVVITPAMVGKKVAVFTSLEAKRSDGGRRSEDQVRWDEQTRAAGGISGFFSHEDEAEAIITDWLKNIEQPV